MNIKQNSNISNSVFQSQVIRPSGEQHLMPLKETLRLQQDNINKFNHNRNSSNSLANLVPIASVDASSLSPVRAPFGGGKSALSKNRLADVRQSVSVLGTSSGGGTSNLNSINSNSLVSSKLLPPIGALNRVETKSSKTIEYLDR